MTGFLLFYYYHRSFFFVFFVPFCFVFCPLDFVGSSTVRPLPFGLLFPWASCSVDLVTIESRHHYLWYLSNNSSVGSLPHCLAYETPLFFLLLCSWKNQRREKWTKSKRKCNTFVVDLAIRLAFLFASNQTDRRTSLLILYFVVDVVGCCLFVAAADGGGERRCQNSSRLSKRHR